MSINQPKNKISKESILIESLRQKGVMRTGEIANLGISREYIRKLLNKGVIEKVGRGLYKMPDSPLSEHHSIVEASLRAPRGIICLASALQFHELTTQMPFEVWMAIERNARKPKNGDVSMRIFRFSKETINSGVEEHIIEGVKVKIFNPAKTIADCFKFRNKIGIDVAIEAFRDCLRKRLCSIDDIWKYAEVCRVVKIIKPYIEALSCIG